MAVILKNNAFGYLSSAIGTGDTSIVLTTGTGSNFPNVPAGYHFYATISTTAGSFEVVKCTARSGDTLTVARGQEGTSAITFPAGSIVEARITAQSIRDAINDGDFTSPYSFGAVGDGVTDDTVAIQAALDASLYVDFGGVDKVYKVTDTLLPRSGQYMVASGATIRQDTSQKPIFDIRNLSNITAVGLKHQGYRTDYVNSSLSLAMAYRAHNSTNVLIQDCEFKWFAYSAVFGYSVNGFKFLNNTVTGPGLISEGGCLNPTATPVITRNNMGVTVGGKNIQVSGNRVTKSAQGIYIVQGSDGVLVSGNIVYDIPVEHGMYVDAGARHVIIADNNVRDTWGVGIKVQWYDLFIPVNQLVAGGDYTIAELGTTDFTTIGAASNTIGVTFTATGAGTGTGQVIFPQPTDITITGNICEQIGEPGTAQGDGILVLATLQQPLGGGITGITQANPGVITTATAHGLSAGDVVLISDVGGMLDINNYYYVNTVPTGTTFTLKDYSFAVVDTSAFGAYTSGGNVAKPTYAKNVVVGNNSVRNCEQDGISLRFVENVSVSGNVVVGANRNGIAFIEGENCIVSNNTIRDIQENGVFFYGALEPSQIKSNALYNTGAAGIDTNARSTGMVVYGNGGVDISQNVIIGESTQTKMQYGIYVTAGDKTRYSASNNTVSYAQDAGARFHGDNNYPLKFLNDNLFSSATGTQIIGGLNELIADGPQRGAIYPVLTGTGPPTTGTWQQGDIIWAIYPLIGSPLGWACVVGGSPGTWTPVGSVGNVLQPTTVDGNLTISGTARRILADFSNATVSSRAMFQSSTTNGVTRVSAIPNGTGTTSTFSAYNSSDPLNSSIATMLAGPTSISFTCSITGTGTYLPILFQNGGSEALRIDTTRCIGVGGASAASDRFSVVGTLPVDATNSTSIAARGTFASTATGLAVGVNTSVATTAASYTITELNGARYELSLGAGSSVTTSVGVKITASFVGTGTAYGVYSDIPAAANRWNFFANGTARNYFAGGLEVVAGTTTMASGFTHIPAAAGAPTGVPTNPTGNVPMYYDTTNNKIYVYNGSWKATAALT